MTMNVKSGKRWGEQSQISPDHPGVSRFRELRTFVQTAINMVIKEQHIYDQDSQPRELDMRGRWRLSPQVRIRRSYNVRKHTLGAEGRVLHWAQMLHVCIPACARACLIYPPLGEIKSQAGTIKGIDTQRTPLRRPLLCSLLTSM